VVIKQHQVVENPGLPVVNHKVVQVPPRSYGTKSYGTRSYGTRSAILNNF
jgi:hypothetical protein